MTRDSIKRLILDALAASDARDGFRTRLRAALREIDRQQTIRETANDR